MHRRCQVPRRPSQRPSTQHQHSTLSFHYGCLSRKGTYFSYLDASLCFFLLFIFPSSALKGKWSMTINTITSLNHDKSYSTRKDYPMFNIDTILNYFYRYKHGSSLCYGFYKIKKMKCSYTIIPIISTSAILGL